MTEEPVTARVPTISGLAPWVSSIRPRQWAKNVLVFAAPWAATAFGVVAVRNVCLTFVAFCAVASATYLANDALDIERDRAHPRKRLRPIAAGMISADRARIVAILLFAVGLGLASLVNSGVLLMVGLYVVTTLSYSAGLKNQPVLDVILVASGFVIRAAAGGLAAEVTISSWFLLVTSFGALLVVSGKRYAELVELVDDRSAHRPTLGTYSAAYLQALVAVSAGMAIITYCLWALENSPASYQRLLAGLSIIPFLAALLRYVLLVMTGAGGEPEDIFLADRPLQVMGLVWLAVFSAGVLLGT
jgi:decaprenyl-phosphate phosphoribosyltransferase